MRRQLGAVALAGGAVLAVAGSLRPLYEQTLADSGFPTGYRMSVWGGEFIGTGERAGLEVEPVRYGVPVVVAAALLALAAVLVVVPLRLPARARVAVRVGAVAAAALLIGSVWTVSQLVVVAVRVNNGEGAFETTVGNGMWILVLACVIAFAGALLVQQRPPLVYQPPDDDDTDTPPMGLAIHPPVSTEESSPG